MFQKEVFGERLKKCRKDAGESQAALADFLGVTTTQISDMENGKTTTTFERLTAICEHYSITSDYLLGLSDRP